MSFFNGKHRLLEEGLKAIADAGAEQVFSSIIEDKGEELKQQYILTMKEKLSTHVNTVCELSKAFDGMELKITVDLLGVSDE